MFTFKMAASEIAAITPFRPEDVLQVLEAWEGLAQERLCAGQDVRFGDTGKISEKIQTVWENPMEGHEKKKLVADLDFHPSRAFRTRFAEARKVYVADIAALREND